jgi:Skp family chaperone for outer membrane proteins
MKKNLLLLIFLTAGLQVTAQTRGIKIGYIDMEYILQKVPDYTEAKNQLELKAQKWKQETEVKKNEIARLKEALKTERVLLTKELIEEREEEIRFQETELSDYQQKRFGPVGDLMTQKAVLVKPIQDQVFTAVQDISEAKKYDFIFDKSSDLTMLFAAKRHDISDQVVRSLTRAARRDQLSKKQLKEEEKKEALEDMQDQNPALAERQKVLDERKAAREKLIADRKAAAEEKKRLAEEKRAQQLADREAKKSGNAPATPAAPENKNTPPGDVPGGDDSEPADKDKDKDNQEKGNTAAEERARKLEERKKAAEDRRAQILAEREAAKKAKDKKPKEETETED